MDTLFNWKKTLILISGLPGSGKSTLARSLVDENQIIENDDYWQLGGKYCYEQQMTHLAGWWCMAEAFRLLRTFDTVVVANTFIKREHVIGYVTEARKLGVFVKLMRPTTKWANDVEKCFKTNIHGVPMEVIQRMKDQQEEITQEEIDVLLGMYKSDNR